MVCFHGYQMSCIYGSHGLMRFNFLTGIILFTGKTILGCAPGGGDGVAVACALSSMIAPYVISLFGGGPRAGGSERRIVCVHCDREVNR